MFDWLMRERLKEWVSEFIYLVCWCMSVLCVCKFMCLCNLIVKWYCCWVFFVLVCVFIGYGLLDCSCVMKFVWVFWGEDLGYIGGLCVCFCFFCCFGSGIVVVGGVCGGVWEIVGNVVWWWWLCKGWIRVGIWFFGWSLIFSVVMWVVWVFFWGRGGIVKWVEFLFCESVVCGIREDWRGWGLFFCWCDVCCVMWGVWEVFEMLWGWGWVIFGF